MPCAAPLDKFVDHAADAAGAGTLRVDAHGAASVVTAARAQSPLKLLTPRNHGRAAWVYASTYGGGLVDGDAIALDVAVGAGAAALLSTQASTKVYRSARGSSSMLTAQVARDAWLISWPDPVVCFADAIYTQTQRIAVDEGGSFVGLDWMTSGRRARGERWAFSRYRSQLSIVHAGRPVCFDAVTLDRADGDIAERFGRFDVLATVVVIGGPLRAEAARLMAAVSAGPLAKRADRLMAASALADGGVLLRMAGRTVDDVGRSIRGLFSFLPAVLGDDPWTRKW